MKIRSTPIWWVDTSPVSVSSGGLQARRPEFSSTRHALREWRCRRARRGHFCYLLRRSTWTPGINILVVVLGVWEVHDLQLDA